MLMKDWFGASCKGRVLLRYKSRWAQQGISLALEVTDFYLKGESTTELCDIDSLDKILSFFLCRSSSHLVSHWFLIFLKLVFLLLFPNTMSQVPGSHKRVGLPSELPATERAHFGDKFKQRSGPKVQVNARTFQNSIVKKKNCHRNAC